ncbi:GerAB/ArcD/ProY family transporter [Ureibacillus sinduriensis]|uniref:Spore gernimation protein n=1 Tax=Ureibacillus sinduriensis BLB-1 = JCM 15800 TaxID=1384057 RepID=A0A0A3HWU4_9BACL|nr:endospore germination permease [Ureibacillus sinduriensis]KGR76909.1 spore gernimation protein [Ureibacillus sinduriensis BLB-1 = JCM 15800]
MHKIGQIGILHVIFIVMTFIGLKNHVTILPPILEHVKRDGWMSVILAALFMFPWLFLILFIHNKTNQKSLKKWLHERIGKVGSSIIVFSTAGFIFLLAAFSLRETILWISSTFLISTPKILLLFVYILLCASLISTNMLTIVIVNTLVLFFVVVFGFYVAIANSHLKDFSLLLPVLEHGFSPVLKGIVYPASGFIELFLLLFIQQHFKSKLKWYHLAIMLFILTGLTLGPLIGAIVEFGPEEAARQRYPAFEEWGLVTIGRFIEHMDFLSIYQWLTGTFIRVGLLLFIAAELLDLTGKRKKIWAYMIPPFFFVCLILLSLDDSLFLQLNSNEMLIATFLFFFVLSLLLGMIAAFSGNGHKNKIRTSTTKSKNRK